MRIITRPDFDGIVCAVLIIEAEKKELPIVWLEPSHIQNGSADIKIGDIMANLPFDARCSLWFDHHISNKVTFEQYSSSNSKEMNIKEGNTKQKEINGLFKIAPSAASVVYQYYSEQGKLNSEQGKLNSEQEKLNRNFDELIRETDIIDAAMLSMDQVLHPENYPYILLSMTVKNRDDSDPPYWNRLVRLLRQNTIEEIIVETEVKKRCNKVIEENMGYADILRKYTRINGNISITDFRSLDRAPSGNRFLTYSLFPECIASVKIRYDDHDNNTVLVSIGKSIFNDGFKINIGNLLAKYGGGGHAGAGGCSINASQADKYLNEILDMMMTNLNEALH